MPHQRHVTFPPDMHVTLPPHSNDASRQLPHVTVENAQAPFYCGIDIGGTGIKIGLVDDLGRTLGSTSVATDPHDGFDAALERIVMSIDGLVGQAGMRLHDIAGVGCGIPGLIDVAAGTLIGAHNLPTWDRTPVATLLSEKLGLPVTFANDGNAASYGEFWIGRGRRQSSLVLITLGTGVGGGIVLNDELVHGAHDFGGEIGHLIIDGRDDARMCGCGRTGHLEAYCSATAVRQRTEEALAAGANGRLSARRANGLAISTLDVCEAAKAGDATALRMMRETARYLGIGITSILHMLDPEIVLIGGAMTFGGDEDPLGREFLEAVRAEVRHRGLRIQSDKSIIEFALLGGSAGYIGAAGLARNAARKSRAM